MHNEPLRANFPAAPAAPAVPTGIANTQSAKTPANAIAENRFINRSFRCGETSAAVRVPHRASNAVGRRRTRLSTRTIPRPASKASAGTPWSSERARPPSSHPCSPAWLTRLVPLPCTPRFRPRLYSFSRARAGEPSRPRSAASCAAALTRPAAAGTPPRAAPTARPPPRASARPLRRCRRTGHTAASSASPRRGTRASRRSG